MSELKTPVEGEMTEETVEKNETVVSHQDADANTTAAESGKAAEKSFDEMTFEEALEASLKNLNTDQKVKGVVLAVNPTEVQVDIGRKQTGIIPLDELSFDVNLKVDDIVKVGDQIDLIVMKTNDQEGIIMLSKKRLDQRRSFDDVVKAKESGEVLTGIVTEVVRGGVIVTTKKGARVFVPASLVSLSRIEDLNELYKKEVDFKVIDIDEKRRRTTGSIKAVLRDIRNEERNALWAGIEEGKAYKGTVKSLTSYGAFVDIGGVDGMVHISELTWGRIKHPSEIVKVDDVVEVMVKSFDPEKRKISLTYKKTEDNPWEILKAKYQVGDTAEVKIVSLTTFGAFAELIPGVDGLIHISQIANRRIERPSEVLKVGEKVEVKITEIDYDQKRVSLSIRALLSEEEIFPELPKEEETAEAEVEETTSVAVAEEAPVETAQETTAETEETETEE